MEQNRNRTFRQSGMDQDRRLPRNQEPMQALVRWETLVDS